MKKISLVFFACCLWALALHSQDDTYYSGDQVSVTVKSQTVPPPLPVYEQPPCPYEGYLWTPGYWAWGALGYYWVPGVWVRPPHPGLLWTPGYWGFAGGWYGWHGGYWGPHVGFYGGVCYGFGYGGVGFYGGRWAGGVFQYNTAAWHVNTAVIHNTYVNNVSTQGVVNHTSFNGQGGVQATPTASEQTAMSESHVQPTTEQISHQQAASTNKAQLASANHGVPATTAMNATNGQHFTAAGHASGPALPAKPVAASNASTAPKPTTAQPSATQAKTAQPASSAAKPTTPASSTQAAKPASASTSSPSQKSTAPRQMQARPRGNGGRRYNGGGGGAKGR
jgi:hypothetical protein